MIIKSPVDRWPGEVVLPDYLTLPQCAAWERAAQATRDCNTKAEIHQALFPAILAIVSEWRLENFPAQVTLETFPGSPRKDSTALIDAMVEAIARLYSGEEVPNV